MPYAPLHVTAQQDGLMAEVGTWPADGEYRLYTGDPTEDGLELTVADGYDAVSAAAVTWAVDAGEPSISATLSYTATAEWGEVAEWWGFHDAGGDLRFYMPFVESFDVQAAGANETTLTIWYDHDYEVDD